MRSGEKPSVKQTTQVLDALAAGDKVSREIAQRTGLTVKRAAAVLSELRRERLVRVVGRRPTRVCCPRCGYEVFAGRPATEYEVAT